MKTIWWNLFIGLFINLVVWQIFWTKKGFIWHYLFLLCLISLSYLRTIRYNLILKILIFNSLISYWVNLRIFIKINLLILIIRISLKLIICSFMIILGVRTLWISLLTSPVISSLSIITYILISWIILMIKKSLYMKLNIWWNILNWSWIFEYSWIYHVCYMHDISWGMHYWNLWNYPDCLILFMISLK